MTGKTHIIGGTTVSAALFLLDPQVCQDPVSGTLRMIATSALCLLGSVLPDIDLPTSLVGHSCKILSVPINKLFGHRGFFHSLAFAVLPLLLAHLFAPHLMWAVSALSAGILSHLALDLLNPAGEAILWPCVKRFHVVGIRMGGAIPSHAPRVIKPPEPYAFGTVQGGRFAHFRRCLVTCLSIIFPVPPASSL